MRVQLSHPTDHPAIVGWPLTQPLADWQLADLHEVLGIHRHEVRLVEVAPLSYVVKELPDHLAEREFRLLRWLADHGLPTVEVVAVCTGRGPDMGGLVVSRFLDYSLPYRTLLAGRGLQIPYLGERLLDALASLLVRLHLVGFYWGDCSLSNTLFLRDAGALSAYIIDVETSEVHESLSDGQRLHDLEIAVENLAGGLLDLEAANRLMPGIDPLSTALAMEETYERLWIHVTGVDEFDVDETYRVAKRLEALHELGFDVSELELHTMGIDGSTRVRLIPRVVEHGYHAQRLATLTGVRAGENQARALLDDIHRYGVVLEQRTGRRLREPTVADTWLEDRFEPTMATIPADLAAKLAPAELYHQVLEHRWLLSERAGRDIGLHEAIESYLDVLAGAPDETVILDSPSLLLPVIDANAPRPDDLNG